MLHVSLMRIPAMRMHSMDANTRGALRKMVADILGWIDATIERYRGDSMPVAEFGFTHLPHFYSRKLLESSRVVVVEGSPPLPPAILESMEILNLAESQICGITYRTTFFVNAEWALDESLHFHEMVHVLQWEHMGPRRFLSAYALELLKHGYVDNALERMAYSHQGRFDKECEPYDVEREVRRELRRMSKTSAR